MPIATTCFNPSNKHNVLFLLIYFNYIVENSSKLANKLVGWLIPPVSLSVSRCCMKKEYCLNTVNRRSTSGTLKLIGLYGQAWIMGRWREGSKSKAVRFSVSRGKFLIIKFINKVQKLNKWFTFLLVGGELSEDIRACVMTSPESN